MDLHAFRELLTPAGQALLRDATLLEPTEASFLACVKALSKRHPAHLVKPALQTLLLRQKARAKFSRADQMYFTRESLEQSSRETISQYRARRFAPYGCVADLCCGIGGDAVGLAASAGLVLAVDRDELRLGMAEENLRAYDLGGRAKFIQGDVLAWHDAAVEAVFCDPDRRADGTRRVDPSAYCPALDELIRAWQPRTPAIGVKLAPAVPLSALAPHDGEAEFISTEGELRECVLWLDPLRTASRRATVVAPDGGHHTLFSEGPPPACPCRDGVPEPPFVLYDPDPAVVRAGLLANLAGELNAALVDPAVAFLASDRLRQTPFATAYQVEEVHAFAQKKLRQRLRELDTGSVTVLKRGSAVDVNEFTRAMKLTGSSHRTVILTRAAGRPVALLGRRLD